MKKIKSAITSLSIYDHGTYLKMKNNWTTPHFCGGLATILVLLMLLAIMVMKMIQIFDRQTMTVSMENTVSSSFIKTSVATSMTNQSFYPFMIGLHQEGIFEITAFTNDGQNEVEILLENCSLDHFKGFPDIKTVFQMVEVSRMKCLPLNKTYRLGGIQYINQVDTINIKVTCLPYQTCTSENSIQMVSMYGIVNPFDKQNPALMYGTTRTFPFFSPGQMNPAYIMSLNKKTVTTNRAIWPFQKNTEVSVVHSLSDNIILNDGGQNSLKFQIWSSQEEVNYQRNFVTLLDGLAYIGGIFGSLVSIFFFMRAYGQAFFVNMFASEVFGSKYAKNYGFKEYLRGCVAGILGICKTVDWEQIKEEEQIEKTVSRTLSLEYLFRRIEYLQNAIEINFESHQLKGLHLLKKSTREQNNERYKQYLLRQRLIEYFKNRGHIKLVEGKEQGLTSAENMAVQAFQGTQKDDFFSEVDGSVILEEDSHPDSEEEKEERKRAKMQQIEREILCDLKQLVEEAMRQNGNPQSKLIYSRLDSRMKECLAKMSMKKEKKKNM